MEQRRLRLGDTLDDYCPRERRVTNHAIVAMVEDGIKQTRCTTCDAEHPYKGARVPKRRPKETSSALYKEVLAGMPETEPVPLLTTGVGQTPDAPAVQSADAAVELPFDGSEADADPGADSAGPVVVEDGPVHRQLIRAQLPRVEGHKEERRLPEFTIRQAGGRGNGHFRSADPHARPRGGAPVQGGNGNRSGGAPRFAGPRTAQPARGPAGRGGPAAGFRGGQPRQGGSGSGSGGGRKRSR
jgi:hypothetical protein